MVTKLELKICHQIFVTNKNGDILLGTNYNLFKKENIIQDFPDFRCLLKNAPRMERLFE